MNQFLNFYRYRNSNCSVSFEILNSYLISGFGIIDNCIRIKIIGLRILLTVICSAGIRKRTSVDLKKERNSVALVRIQTIQTERPPLVGDVSAKFYR
jgi:hypothetical protein